MTPLTPQNDVQMSLLIGLPAFTSREVHAVDEYGISILSSSGLMV